jgi:2-hydroxy-3-keto-5-methylthiopentenyl-1-phosphate phosphatase
MSSLIVIGTHVKNMLYWLTKDKFAMCSISSEKTLIQCDFDGTVTEEDVSFLILDTFARGNWRKLLEDYRKNKISVDYFNKQAFTMVRASRETLTEFVRTKAKIRCGFKELTDYCYKRGLCLVIVSNGLDFYINVILSNAGIRNIEVFAAQTKFCHEGIEVQYIGPDGNEANKGLKELYARLFLAKGYRLIYLGNGVSDIHPARLAHHVFARDDLLSCCARENIACIPFTDFTDVLKGLKLLPQSRSNS